MRGLLGGMAACAALAVAACGGGGGNGDGDGQQVTDPARVPSSTPIKDAVLYQIRGDVVTTSGGAAATVATSATPAASGNYTVVSGDTCSSIAAKYSITTDQLIAANRTIDAACRNLRTGEQLKIPGTPASTPAGGTASRTATPSGRTYTVQTGDTCDAIARNQGVTAQAIVSLNGLDAGCKNLQVGQVLRIP